jgi:hypothetical protein
VANREKVREKEKVKVKVKVKVREKEKEVAREGKVVSRKAKSRANSPGAEVGEAPELQAVSNVPEVEAEARVIQALIRMTSRTARMTT